MKSLSQRPFRYTFCLSVSVGRRFRSSCFPGKPSKLSLWDQLFTDRFSASHLSHFSLWFPSMFADLGPCYQTTLGTSNLGTAAGLTECPPTTVALISQALLPLSTQGYGPLLPQCWHLNIASWERLRAGSAASSETASQDESGSSL